MSWSYDSARRLLNEITVDKFVTRPWDGYTGIPAGLLERMRIKDGLRLYLHSLYGSFWYLGERLARQISWDLFVVPVDPPACLFVQTKIQRFVRNLEKVLVRSCFYGMKIMRHLLKAGLLVARLRFTTLIWSTSPQTSLRRLNLSTWERGGPCSFQRLVPWLPIMVWRVGWIKFGRLEAKYTRGSGERQIVGRIPEMLWKRELRRQP